MPDGDDQPVSFGRWQEAHAAHGARLTALEQAAGKRKDRAWGLTLAVLSGLALPAILLLAGILIHRATG